MHNILYYLLSYLVATHCDTSVINIDPHHRNVRVIKIVLYINY